MNVKDFIRKLKKEGKADLADELDEAYSESLDTEDEGMEDSDDEGESLSETKAGSGLSDTQKRIFKFKLKKSLLGTSPTEDEE